MMFDPSTRYGGWIDRVKGIISAYELARLTGRTFRLFAGPTFPLGELIEPAGADWNARPSDLTWNPITTTFHVSRDRPSVRFARLRASSRARVFVETNLDYLPQLHPARGPGALHRLWGQRYRELFRLKPDLEEEVRRHTRPGTFAIHARFTGLLGDFKDVVMNALEPAARAALLRECLTRVETLARADSARQVLVFSDSVTFLDAVSRVAPNVEVLPGAPAHIDHTDAPRHSLRKTLLDFYVMTRCAKIALLRTGPMYDSNFSRYASYVNDVPFIEVS